MELFMKNTQCPEHPEHYLENRKIGIKSREFPEGVGIFTHYCPILDKYYVHGKFLTKEEFENKIENSSASFKKGGIKIIEPTRKLENTKSQ